MAVAENLLRKLHVKELAQHGFRAGLIITPNSFLKTRAVFLYTFVCDYRTNQQNYTLQV